MEWSLKYTALVYFLTFVVRAGVAQENYASNVSTRLSDNDKLMVVYDINPIEGAQTFTVVLFVTYEGNEVKVTTIDGESGANLKSGKGKTIVWHFKDDFSGNIEDLNIDVFAYKENEPQANFKVLSVSNNGYGPCEVTFKNLSLYANEFYWDFGDQNSGAKNFSLKTNPVHYYENGRIYTLSLIARNTNLKLEDTIFKSIEIKKHDPVISNFTIEGNNQTVPARVFFKNTSVNADSYIWDFGNPSTGRKNVSTLKDGKQKYKRPGTYNVKLIVKNDFSGLSDTVVEEVCLKDKKALVADFVFTKSSEEAPSVVSFTNTSTNSRTYEWNFDDPASFDKNKSDKMNPEHLYLNPGNYVAELTVWSKGLKKSDKVSETITLKEKSKHPNANFSIQNNNVFAPATILFSNQSKNAVKYKWDFGDPESGEKNISGKMNPTHTYNKPGRYKVALIAYSSDSDLESTFSSWVILKSR